MSFYPTNAQKAREERYYDRFPEAKEIEVMKQYFKEKIKIWSDSFVNNIKKRTRENIFNIVSKLIGMMEQDNRRWVERFKYIPSGITHGWKNSKPTLTEIFDRAKTEYEAHPEKLLRDLGLYSEYYKDRLDWEHIDTPDVYIPSNQALEKAIRIWLDSIPSHPLFGKPRKNEFWLNKHGIVAYVWSWGQRWMDYSELLHRIQMNYEDLIGER
jgi:hypothetical protein